MQYIICFIMFCGVFIICLHKQINAWLNANPNATDSINNGLDAIVPAIIVISICLAILGLVFRLFGGSSK